MEDLYNYKNTTLKSEVEMTEILRNMVHTYQKIEENDKEAYIEMPHFGKEEHIDMKAIDAFLSSTQTKMTLHFHNFGSRWSSTLT